MLPAYRLKLRNLLIKHEGFKAVLTTDTTGHYFYGYGHDASTPISTTAGGVILDDDIQWHATHLPLAWPLFNSLSDARKCVLMDMSYNLGLQGLLEFKEMLAALEAGNYDEAADQMLNSLWAKQVGDRAIEDADIMRNDEL